MDLEFLVHPATWLLGLAFVLVLIVYLGIFRRLGVARVTEPDESDAGLPPVSIVIPARNEDETLQNILPLILNQDYPKFEVIVVDDQSDDDTKYVLQEFELGYPNLKVVRIEEHVYEFAGKKLALTLGFKAAKYDILLLTDADCVPESNRWIRSMVQPYKNRETDIVLGYSPYIARPGILNWFIQFDTFYTALQYFSMALGHNPYMGVGRNLSYRKNLFFKNKGFAPFLKVPSGDDDLFVNQNANSRNTAVQLHPDSFMLSIPKERWSDWLRQKRRHLSTGKLYKSGHKSLLAFIWFTHVLLYISLILGLIFIRPIWVPLAVYGLFLIIQMIIHYLGMRKLRQLFILPLVPILDPLYQLIYLPVMGLIGSLGKRKRW